MVIANILQMLHMEGWHYKERKNSSELKLFCKAKKESEKQNERRKKLCPNPGIQRIFQHCQISTYKNRI